MSIHIIQGTRVNSDGSDCAALYDFATGMVLATPIFEDADEAEAFVAWCTDARGEPSKLSSIALQQAVEDFRAGRRTRRCPSCNVLPGQHHRFRCATRGEQQIVLPATVTPDGTVQVQPLIGPELAEKHGFTPHGREAGK